MSVTLTAVAPLITWLLVRISPLDVSTMPVPSEVAFWSPSVAFTSTRPGSTLLAICDVDSAVCEVDVADPPVADPCDNPTATPAPAPAATIAVAVSPSIVRPRCRLGGCGAGYCPYCPYGYCANGSLIGPAPPNRFRGPASATHEASPPNLGGPRRDDQLDLPFS